MKLGIIGIGGHGAGHLRAILNGQGAELAGIADANEALARQAGEQNQVPSFTRWQDLLEHVPMEGLVVCVPHDLYDEIIAAACSKKLHVLKEKPVARNLEEGKRFVHYAESAGVKLMVGTQRRFSPAFQTMRARQTAVAPLFMFRSHYSFCWGPDFAWRGVKERAGGGAMLDMGYHPIDQMLWQMGAPSEVYAVCSNKARPGTPFPYDTDDTAILTCRYENGSIGYILMSWATSPPEESVYLHGANGVLKSTWNELTHWTPQGELVEEQHWAFDGYDALRTQLETFIQCVQSGSVPPSSAQEQLANMAILDAAYHSAETGAPQKVVLP